MAFHVQKNPKPCYHRCYLTQLITNNLKSNLGHEMLNKCVTVALKYSIVT